MYGVVVVQAEIIASDGGNIVGLARMGVGIVSVEQDALPLEVGDALVDRDLGKVLAGRYGVSKRRSSTIPADVGRHGGGGRTWFSSQMEMKRSKAFPGTFLAAAAPTLTTVNPQNSW